MRKTQPPKNRMGLGYSHNTVSIVGLGLMPRLAFAFTLSAIVWAMVLGVIQG